MNKLSFVPPGLIAPLTNPGVATGIFLLFDPKTLPLTPKASALPAVLGVNGAGGKLGGLGFFIRASGEITVAGTSPTVNVLVQSGKSATPGANTTLATLGSNQAVTTSATYPFTVELYVQAGPISGILQGRFSITLNNVASASAALTNTLTGLAFVNDPTFNVVVGINFGVSNAANAAVLNELCYGF